VSDLKLAETVASRGHNLVCIAPPSASAARAVLGGILEPGEPAKGLRLALAPPEAVEEWARVAARVAAARGRRVAGAHTPGRLTRLVKSGTIDLIVTPPDTALDSVRRAALKLEELAGLLLLWPEAWGGEESGAALLQDLPKPTQRVVVTSDPAGSASLIERYCWRAPVTDLLGPAPVDTPPPVRSMPAPWSQRNEALLDLVEQLDPETVAVWVADPAEAVGIEQTLAAAGVSATVGDEIPAAAALVVAFDLPSPSLLRQLAAAGDLVLLVPPGTEAYVARMAPHRRPIHALGQLQAAQAGLARSRRTIVDLLERGPARAAYFAIAPLLERHEATAVAAGLYELWEQARAAATELSAPVRPAAATVRLWIGAGKRDAVTAHDLVGALLKECGAPKEAIGKVEIRDTFSLVELGGAVDADQIAEKLTGKVIRKRRVVAKVDKGRPGGGGRQQEAGSRRKG
jgi:hypothetical protein